MVERGKAWLCLALVFLFGLGLQPPHAAAGPGDDPGGPPQAPGGGSGGIGDPGFGSGDGPSGGGDGPSDGGDGGPDPPAPPDVTVPLAPPPFPNLVIPLVHPDRDAIQLGHSLHFYAAIENIGYRNLVNATVALYDGLKPGVLIQQADVALEDFHGAVDFTWTPTVAGNHTIRAAADPHQYVEETNESDNERSVVVAVTSGPPIGKPDLSVMSGDISPATDVMANATAPVNVTVRNLGDAPAVSVVVEVWEEERTLMIANYTIVSVLSGSADTRAVSWTPDGTGARHLEVRVDPYGTIAEYNETNNVASEGFNVRPPGPLSPAQPPFIQPWCPLAVVHGDFYVPPGVSVTIANCYVRVIGNVLVDGSLTLISVTLELAASSNNQYRVEVRPGAFLSFSASVLTPYWASNGISALALPGSTFYFHQASLARWLYGKPNAATPGGLQVYTPNVQIDTCNVLAGRGHGVYVGPGLSAGTIHACGFLGNRGAGILFASGSSATV